MTAWLVAHCTLKIGSFLKAWYVCHHHISTANDQKLLNHTWTGQLIWNRRTATVASRSFHSPPDPTCSGPDTDSGYVLYRSHMRYSLESVTLRSTSVQQPEHCSILIPTSYLLVRKRSSVGSHIGLRSLLPVDDHLGNCLCFAISADFRNSPRCWTNDPEEYFEPVNESPFAWASRIRKVDPCSVSKATR